MVWLNCFMRVHRPCTRSEPTVLPLDVSTAISSASPWDARESSDVADAPAEKTVARSVLNHAATAGLALVVPRECASLIVRVTPSERLVRLSVRDAVNQ